MNIEKVNVKFFNWNVLVLGLFLSICPTSRGFGQFLVAGDTLYANEWIGTASTYLKLSTGVEGLSRVRYEDLRRSGWLQIEGSQLTLRACGVEQPLFVSSDDTWGPGDYLLYYSNFTPCQAFDHSTYDGTDESALLNPDYPTYSDTLVYFLSQESGSRRRYTRTDPAAPGIPDTVSTAWARVKALQVFSRFGKVTDQFNGSYSSFRDFEGFGYGQRQRTSLSYRTYGYLPGTEARLALRTRSSIVSNHRFFVLANGDTLLTRDIGPIQFQLDELTVSPSFLTTSNVNVFVVGGALSSTDRFEVGQGDLLYQRVLFFNAVQPALSLQSIDREGDLVWSLGGVSSQDTLLALNISQDRIAIGATGEAQIRLPAALNDVIEIRRSAALLQPVITQVSFGEEISPQTDYLIVASKLQNTWSVNAMDWAQYRSSAQGGGWNVQVVYVEDLYNRFGYGIPRSPLAIRNAISRQALLQPNLHVLLIGKGLEFHLVRRATQLAAVDSASYYIPTFGTPGADNLLAFNPLTRAFTAAIGRVAVQNEEQLATVFTKVQAADRVVDLPQTLEAKEWSKKLIHLVGGGNVNEQAQFRFLMDNASQALRDSEFGALFSSYYKDSERPIQQADSDELFADINEGARILTFLGHGSQSTLDFNIDLPERYDNAGRLPLINALGCFTGNMHTPGLSLGERFVLEDEKIALGFAASTGLGYPFQLTRFLTDLYSNLGTVRYGETTGAAYRAAYQVLSNTNSRIAVQLAEQFNLQGDPGVRIDAGAAPDYVFDPESIELGPEPLVANLDTVALSFTIKNLGRQLADTVLVKLFRSNTTGTDVLIDSVAVPIRSGLGDSEVRFVSGLDGGGLNSFTLHLESRLDQGPLPEASSNDVYANFQAFFLDQSVSITYPPRAGVLGVDEPAIVYANSGSPWDNPRAYEWQWSRDPGFPQGATQSELVSSRSLIRLDLSAEELVDQPIYVRIRDTARDSVWSSTHFSRASATDPTEIFGLEDQAQLALASDNSLYVDSMGSWAFRRFALSKSIRNKEFISTDPPTFVTNYDGPAGSIRPWNYLRSGIAILIGDEITGVERFNAAPGEHGSINGGGFNRAFMYPGDTKANRDLAVRLIDSIAPTGSYIYLFTCYRDGFDLDVSSWTSDSVNVGDRSIFGILREHGAQLLPQWASSGTVPYTAIFQKGTFGMMAESVGASRDDVIFDEIFLDLSSESGLYKTEDLAGAVSLTEASWEIDFPDPSRPASFLRTRVVGQTPIGDTTHIATGSGPAGRINLQGLDVSGFERLWLEHEQEDSLRQAFPINSLRLYGTPLPEYVFDPQQRIDPPKDSALVGERVEFGLGLRRLGREASSSSAEVLLRRLSDSLILLRDTLRFAVNQEAVDWSSSFESLTPAETQTLIYQLDPLTSKDLRAGNNLAVRSLEVLGDDIAPNLKILHAGETATNDLLLSANPHFMLEVRDAGSEVELLTTASLDVRLVDPTGQELLGAALPGVLEPLPPAGANVAAFDLRFEDLPRGPYTLAARVRDEAGNLSGPLQEIRFEVDDRLAMSNIVPYPNPMVDNVRFHYELTGGVPVDYQIDIYSTSGRLVRSLGPQELGSLRLGRHTTDLSWDGSTAFGERLAAGTYLYRFSVGDAEEGQLEQRETALDAYIKSGFGKLVILPR